MGGGKYTRLKCSRVGQLVTSYWRTSEERERGVIVVPSDKRRHEKDLALKYAIRSVDVIGAARQVERHTACIPGPIISRCAPYLRGVLRFFHKAGDALFGRLNKIVRRQRLGSGTELFSQ